MGQEERIKEQFYENPGKRWTIRELEKKTKIPKSTTHRILNKLKKEGFLNNEFESFENFKYKIEKINFFVKKIVYSGIIEEIIHKYNPSCIIIFGSMRKGESDQKSDIDIFVESFKEKKIDLSKYEKVLKHKIDLFVNSSINNLPKNLRNNILNGLKIYGTLKLK